MAAPAHLLLSALADTALPQAQADSTPSGRAADSAPPGTAADTRLPKPAADTAPPKPGAEPAASLWPASAALRPSGLGAEAGCPFSAEAAWAEAPLTSEPPLPDTEPLTSEPPLAETAPLTSEAAFPAGEYGAECADAGAGRAEP